MASYFTRAKARSDDTQPGDSASMAATTPVLSSSSVERNVEFTGGSESMSIEVAGPMTTHPQQFPEGGHPPVGGHGVTGSADPPQVGGTLRSPSERADPLEREEASAIEASAMAESVIKLPAGSGDSASLRQPPTVSDTTAAASLRSTLIRTDTRAYSSIYTDKTVLSRRVGRCKLGITQSTGHDGHNWV